MATENAAVDPQPYITAIGTVLGGAIVYCVQFLRGRKSDEPSGKQLILEHADQADLATVKDLAAQLKTMISLIGDISDFRDDMEASKQATLRIGQLLERLEVRFNDMEKKAIADEAFRRGQEDQRRKAGH